MRREDTWRVVFSKLLTVENLSVQKKQQKCVKRIPPPNAAIPLANPILRTSLLCQIGDYPPDYLIQNRQLVCIRNSIQELFNFFPAVGTILVLVAACFYSEFYWKSIQKLIFPAFGTILVLVAACFYSNFNLKKIKNCSSFWHDLGFGGSFFLQKNCKKIQKGYLLQTQPYPWWTLYLEPPFCVRFGILHLITWFRWGSLFLFAIQSSKVFENCFFQLLARSWFRWQPVSIQNSSKKVFKNCFFQLLARSWFWWQFFSIQNSSKKKNWKIDFFQFLARSWFWRQLVCIQNSMKKIFKNLFFPVFGTILVLVAAFVCKKTACLFMAFVCFIKFRKNRGSKYEVQQGMVPFWGI